MNFIKKIGFGQSEEEKATEKAEKKAEIEDILAGLKSNLQNVLRLRNITDGIKQTKYNIGSEDKKYIIMLCQGTDHANTVGNTIDRWNNLNKNPKETASHLLKNIKNDGYVATAGRVILNGGGQKRVVYKKAGKGEEYVKVGGEFVNLKRNYTRISGV